MPHLLDPLVANLLWAALLGISLGAIVGVLVAAAGKRRVEPAERSGGRAFLSSFRYVLEGDSEGALEELAGRSSTESDALATSFALGAHFRRKGDLVRAVRLHEGILALPGIAADWRRSAEYELGVDFRRLGMFSRATESLERVLADAPDHREALRELREICEETGDWERAAAHQRRLVELGASSPILAAHLHAGHARKLLVELRLDEAELALERAFEADPRCADAFVARAEVALARGDGGAAAAALGEAHERKPEVLPAIFPLLEAAFAARGAYAELGAFLEGRLERTPEDLSLRLALARHLRRRRLAPEAARQLRLILEADPQEAEARLELGELLLDGSTDDDLRLEIRAFVDCGEGGRSSRAIVKGPGNPPRPFLCGDCAMELTQFFFRCPRCYAWDTIARAQGPTKRVARVASDHGIPRRIGVGEP